MTVDLRGLVRRLRDLAAIWEPNTLGRAMSTAADELERLSAEVERLRALLPIDPQRAAFVERRKSF